MAAEPPEDFASAAVVPALSCGNRHIRFGVQKIGKTVVNRRENDLAMMSTKLLCTGLAQKNCMEPKESPTTRMAGVTSKASLHPTMARTSQKGTMMQVIGRMRPIIALRSDSGKPLTAAKVCTGVPMAPHATGEVLAIRFSTAA